MEAVIGALAALVVLGAAALVGRSMDRVIARAHAADAERRRDEFERYGDF